MYWNGFDQEIYFLFLTFSKTRFDRIWLAFQQAMLATCFMSLDMVEVNSMTTLDKTSFYNKYWIWYCVKKLSV